MIGTRNRAWALGLALLFGVAGCARSVRPPPASTKDATTPKRSKPRAERAPSGQKPFAVGEASFYGERFHGRLTANGERFDMNAMTAAHRSLKFGSCVVVENALNGRRQKVRVNDRGPFVHGRILDVSKGAARKLGMLEKGVVPVRLYRC